MRWAQVTPAQLEDDEFLLKQLRRLEIASSVRRSTRRDGAKALGSNWDDLDQDHLIRERIANAKAKAARGAGADQENEDGEGKKDDNQSAVRFTMLKPGDEQQEREIVNSLCLLGDLSSDARAALMQQRLKTALRQQCAFPNPLYRLIAIRRKIMRHVQAAVAVQQHQRLANLLQWSDAVDAIREATLSPTPGLASMHPSEVVVGVENAAKKGVSACEGSVGLQMLSCLIACMRDSSVSAILQKKIFLRDVLQLLASMPRLALAPVDVDDSSAQLSRDVSPQKTKEITMISDSVHDFLLDMCPKPSARPSGPTSPKVHAVGSVNGEFDLEDRSNAVSALLHLAGLTGSVKDFLAVVKVLLGVPDRTRQPNQQVCSCSSSTRSLSSPSSVSPAAIDNTIDSDGGSRPSTAHDLADVEVKSKFQTDKYKQEGSENRTDSRDSRDPTACTAAESDNVSPTYLRKGGAKAFGTKPTITQSMPPSTKVNSARSNSVMASSPMSKSRQRDECDSIFPTGSLSITLDANSAWRESISRTTPLVTPRVQTPPLTSRCPRLKPLCADIVIAQLQSAEAGIVPQQLRASSGGAFSFSFHELGVQDAIEGDEREVWSCGQNSYGELGHGDTIPRKSFERIESLQGKDIALLGAGNEHTIALTSDGKVYTCGYNDNGQCGQGGNTRISHMTELPKLGEGAVAQVHAYNGCEHSIFVMSSGRVATCGYNYRGQLGHGNTTSESVPKLIRGLENRIVRLVSCSYYHTIMTCEDVGGGGGRVLTFGRNDYGQLGHNDAIDRKVPQEVNSLNDYHIVSVACGQYHSMLVTSTGKVFGFGKNDYGQLGVDSAENQPIPVQVRGGLDKLVALEIRCGYYHTVVLCGGAHLHGFGRNDYGQLGLGKANASAASNFQLQQQRFSQPCLIEDLEGKEIVRFACGCYHTVAVSDSGMLYVFGRNNHGQLGTGDTNERLYPFPIDDFLGKRIAYIAAGFYHTVVLTGGKDEDRDEQDKAKHNCDDNSYHEIVTESPVNVSFDLLLSSPIILDKIKDEAQRRRGKPSINSGPRRDEEYREEDESDEKDMLGDLSPESSRSTDHLNTLQANHSSSASACLALFIIAHLDRLSHTFLLQREFPRAPCWSNLKAVASSTNFFSVSTIPETLFPGSFLPYAVHVRSSTFELVCVLMSQLIERKIEGLSHLSLELYSQAATAPGEHDPSVGDSRQARASSMLQQYILLVCTRLLRANLRQLTRSGIGNVLLALVDATSTFPFDGPNNAKTDLPANEWSRMLSSFGLIRETLSNVIDSKQRSNSMVSDEIVEEAVTAYTESIELLLPCPCLQIQFYQHILADPSSDYCVINCHCKDRSQNGHQCASVRLPRSRKVFVIPSLRRLADDAFVLKLFLLGPTPAARASQSAQTEKHLCDLSQALLTFVEDDFHQRFSALPARTAGSNPTITFAFDAIHSIQKHLVSWASNTASWERNDTESLPSGASSLSMHELMSTLIDRTFRLDKSHIASTPRSWRAIIEFSLMICATCYRVLLAVTSTPCRLSNDAVMSVVGQSIVGKMLPSLAAALFGFTNQPLFAVSLLPNIKGLLKLLDAFNAQFSAINDDEKSFIDSVTTAYIGISANKSKCVSGGTQKDNPCTDRPNKLIVPDVSSASNLSTALRLQWSYRLEKELAVLLSEMAVTLVIGDPVSSIKMDSPQSKLWSCNPLFRGGINPGLLAKSIQNELVSSDMSSRRIVTHSPFPTVAEHLSSSIRGEFAPFSLILPGTSTIENDSTMLSALAFGGGLNDTRKYRRIFSQTSLRKFLIALASEEDINDEWSVNGVKLCVWVRERYLKTDPSYRMLVQLANKQNHVSNSREDQIRMNDNRIETALFAALLHHSALALQAFHFALHRIPGSTSTQQAPPSGFLALWKYVADFRRQIASMKTAIRNQQPSLSSINDGLNQILALQQLCIKRCELLLLVDVYDEEEHANQERDSGFVSAQNPAISVATCRQNAFSTPHLPFNLNPHLQARYTDCQIPFLAAFPSSKWRIVRVLVHTLSRWKALIWWKAKTDTKSSINILGHQIVQFASSSEIIPSSDVIIAFLIDPCRRRSCSTRGFEILWEVLATISYDSIQVDVVHQVTQALVLQSNTNTPATLSADFASLSNAGVYFSAIYNNALSDFLMQLTELIADKAYAAVESQDSSRFWVLAELMASWGMHFDGNQFEFVSDIGILPLLHQLLQMLPVSELTEAEKTRCNPAPRSNSTIPMTDFAATNSPRPGAMVASKQHSQLYKPLWTIFQSISLAFSDNGNCASPDYSIRSISTPLASSVSGPLEVLYLEAQRISKQTIPGWDRSLDVAYSAIPSEGQSSNSTSVGIRRSYDIIASVTRVSPFHRRIVCTYEDMTAPPAGKAALSPLLKPNEFSITTWIYARNSAKSTPEDSTTLELSDRQLVFVRGNEDEINPYLILIPETESTWQIEVGFVLHLPDNESGPPQERREKNGNVLCERLLSKEPIPGDKWVNVAIVVEGSKLRLYINGTFDSQRAVMSQFTAVWATRSVDLPFHFGRIEDKHQTTSLVQKRFPRLAVDLLLYSLSNVKQSGFQRNSNNAQDALQCFDGWISQFRFHNRALSPIHVRVVFDELKAPGNTPTSNTGRTTATACTERSPTLLPMQYARLVDIYALLVQLGSSPDGILQMHNQFTSWMLLLWKTFLLSDSWQLQQSSLRVLRMLLPLVSPITVTQVLNSTVDDTHIEYKDFGFIHQILRAIGVGLAVVTIKKASTENSSTLNSLPWTQLIPSGIHGSLLSSQPLENEARDIKLPSNIVQLEEMKVGHNIIIVNELVELLQHLHFQPSEHYDSSWQNGIDQTIGILLSEVSNPSQQVNVGFGNKVISSEKILQAEVLGCLYFLGGTVDLSLRPGITAQLKLTQDPVRVISHSVLSPTMRSSDIPTVVSLTSLMPRNPSTTSNVRADSINSNQKTWPSQPEYMSVRWDELSPMQTVSAITNHSETSPSLAIHNVLLELSQRILPVFLDRLVESHAWPSMSFLDFNYSSSTDQSEPKPESALEAMQTGNSLLRCLAQSIQANSFTCELSKYKNLVACVFRTASRNDGSVSFETLERVERRTFHLRQRIYSILIDLGEEGSEALVNFLVYSSKTKSEAGHDKNFSPETVSQKQDNVITESKLDTDWGSRTGKDTGYKDKLLDLCKGENDNAAEDDIGDEELDNDDEVVDESDNELDNVGDDEDEDGGDDSESEENRAEFVDELMLMGFPEEWCVLALKQTENDIVSASAWIVDNLDYLSKLQLSLEKKQLELDVTRINNDEDDDEIPNDGEEALDTTCTLDDLFAPDQINSAFAGNTFKQDTDRFLCESNMSSGENITDARSDNSSIVDARISTFHTEGNANGASSRADYEEDFRPPPLSEKEMGRKIFGEMYYPFEEGGYLSSMEMAFLSAWKPNQNESEPPVSANAASNGSKPTQTNHNGCEFHDKEFDDETAKLDLIGLTKLLQFLERQLAVLYCRFLAVKLLKIQVANAENKGELELPLSCQDIVALLRVLLYRGDQLSEYNSHSIGHPTNYISTEDIMIHTIVMMLTSNYDAMMLALCEFIGDQLDTAAKCKQFEAHLWTQRDIRRGDKQLIAEPAVEISMWLTDLVFADEKKHTNRSFINLHVTSLACRLLRRLRSCLAATNLPLKALILHAISRILLVLYRCGCSNEHLSVSLGKIKLSVRELMIAAKQRLSRETAQERLLYSPYMQSYVELLYVMRLVTQTNQTQARDDENRYTPIVSFDLGTVLDLSSEDNSPVSEKGDEPAGHIFDRKRNRTSLLTYSDDGESVSYMGNDSWKATCAEQGLSTGQHEWRIRIDKSSSSYIFVGVATRRLNVDSFLGADDHSWGFIGDKALYYQRNRIRAFSDGFGEGDTIGVHLDCELGTLAFTKNGESLGIAFDNVVGEVYPAVALYSRHQRVSIVSGTTFSSDITSCASVSPLPNLPVWAHDVDSMKGDIDDGLIACELMTCMIERQPVRHEVIRDAYQVTSHWLSGTTKYVVTRAGWSLWVNVTASACEPLGFRAGERVRTARGHGVVAGVAYGRTWIHIDGEDGAWYFHPSKLRVSSLTIGSSLNSPESGKLSGPGGSAPNAQSESSNPSAGCVSPALSLSLDTFTAFAQHPKWGGVMADRQLLRVVDEHCESTRTSPWNLSPDALIKLIRDQQDQQPGLLEAFPIPDDNDTSTTILVARFALLRFFNLAMRRALPFFDLTWKYYTSSTSIASGVYHPCVLLSACRGSIFVCLKNALFTNLMQRTANSPRKAEDEYDYPDDLPHLQVNRLKAAAAKCHPGTTKSLFLSLFGQAFEVLHFLPLRTLRMVYSHPMDDGQLRSFKVKFEGEGADDYGGPYREFFSQFFAELQALETIGEVAEDNNKSAIDKGQRKESPVKCLLPFLLPSPNWRNGVGGSREKFVLNGEIVSVKAGESDHRTSLLAESAEEKRQLYREMFVFLGQMLGICLRTGVCVRLDLATSVWKQLTAEDDATNEYTGGLWDENVECALTSLKETDYVAYSLWKNLRAILEEYSVCLDASKFVGHLEEQLSAMDLDFTTTLSDGHSVELVSGGAFIPVTLANLESYLRHMLQARVHESREALVLLKRGLNSILPVSALAIFTWQELEARLCGVDEIDVSLLRANTEYDEDVSPADEFVQRFWRVLEGMETPDRRAFLRFVWARSRLPMGAAQFHQKFKIQSLAPGNGDGSSPSTGASTTAAMDAQLPKSHTCFFALQLPRYSSDEICRRQLLYAIHNCVEMDGDFRLADTEMSGWSDVAAADQLRL